MTYLIIESVETGNTFKVESAVSSTLLKMDAVMMRLREHFAKQGFKLIGSTCTPPVIG